MTNKFRLIVSQNQSPVTGLMNMSTRGAIRTSISNLAGQQSSKLTQHYEIRKAQSTIHFENITQKTMFEKGLAVDNEVDRDIIIVG
jgi:hypothetical protein